MIESSTCPNCGAVIKNIDPDSGRCEYCGSQIVIKKPETGPTTGVIPAASAASINIPNILTLAKYDMDAGQYKSAYERYTKVMENDVKNIDALMGRAKAIGWLSSWNNLRSKEMMTGYRAAIDQVSGTKKAALTRQAVDDINTLAISYNKALVKELNLDGFSNISAATIDIQLNEYKRWLNFLKYTSPLLQLLDAAHEMDPKYKPVMENIIAICKFYLENRPETVKAVDKTWPKNFQFKDLSDEQSMNTFLEYIKRYTEKIKALDPSYSPPQVNYERGSNAGSIALFVCTFLIVIILLFVFIIR